MKLSPYNPNHKLYTQTPLLKNKNYSLRLTEYLIDTKMFLYFLKLRSKFVIGLGCFVFARHYLRNVVLADFVLFSSWY